jgi:predicted transcriptional regulator
MNDKRSNTVNEKLDEAVGLLQHLLALELAREGVPQQAIAKHIHVAKAKVVKMLKGVKKNARAQQ